MKLCNAAVTLFGISPHILECFELVFKVEKSEEVKHILQKNDSCEFQCIKV